MEHSAEFFKAILDSVTEHIVIIDGAGQILFVNAAWSRFGFENGCLVSRNWQGTNYLAVCDDSAAEGESHADLASRGVRTVIGGHAPAFYHEYPCDSPSERRWFMMRVTPLNWSGGALFIISHQNITERKLAEEQVAKLSLTDGLTGLPNRRHFDEFLAAEVRRCRRLRQPMSLLLLDVDHFKLYNDRYGHQAGDACLRQVADAIAAFAKRPGDLAARYGGEEFALILGNTDAAAATTIAGQILASVSALGLAHADSQVAAVVTASCGVAASYPDAELGEVQLIAAADQALYAAKRGGRNRSELAPTPRSALRCA